MTTMFVASIGGHLTQLTELRPRLQGISSDRAIWVTHDSPQSRSLLAGEEVVYVPYIKERDVIGVSRAGVQAARLIRRHQVDTVVSTGSAIALGYLGMASVMRRQAHFIESTAFLHGHSITGRLLQRMPGVSTYTQSRTLSDRSFRYCGSVLDGYAAVETPTPDIRRVVVTLGTSPQFQFSRLVDRLIAILPPDVEVLWQTGCTEVSDKPIKATPWMPAAALAEAMADADVVIAHAGAGSILAALQAGRRPLIVPRRAEHGEIPENHQLQIASELSVRGLATVSDADYLNFGDLQDAASWRIQRADQVSPVILERV
jgi:UDP-N-acetylglucosamine--N-acetylmuramyl-(pentapeptide) pyrophosphoryl-undecaprenol N-acetylglucosamine transferase